MSTSTKITVYCDWNVFNKLEHVNELEGKERVIYEKLWQLIDSDIIAIPYSNAHISDLARGYQKNPKYIDGHLSNIKLVTHNLCITEYWGDTHPRWHYRDPEEFLKDVLTEQNNTAPDFSSLYTTFDNPLVSAAANLQNLTLRLYPMPSAFLRLYQLNPIFNIMYPRTKKEMNLLAFCDDLYKFALRIKTDFALYKQHKKMIIELKNKFPELRKVVTQAENDFIGRPVYLTWDDAWDEQTKNFNVSHNPQANKIIGLFTTTDLRGYRQDEKFANMLDDATHCFYGSYCDYFLTIDQRCIDKTLLVYKQLRINTNALHPEQFVNKIFKVLEQH